MKRKIFFATYTGLFVFLNIVFFLIFLGFSYKYGDAATSWVALMPSAVLSGHGLWTFLTSMFMHASIGHLFVNMLSLVFIGGFVEKLIGKKRYLWLYLGSGLFAGIFFVLVAYMTGTDMNVYAVGASGAIFGLGGLLAVLTPRLPVLVFFIIPMPMWAAMVFLLAVLWLLSASLSLPVGNVAHLGGFLVGLAYGFYLRQKYPRKASMISRYFAQ
jgi:membrane associated rhomboid family serine protease